MTNLTGLFERPVIHYRPAQAGVGLVNPHALARLGIARDAPDLPCDAWLAEPV